MRGDLNNPADVGEVEEEVLDSTATESSSRRGLATNAGALVASRLVIAVLGWAGTVFIVRNLTPSEWGQFSFVFTLLGMLSFITALGSSRVVLAELTRNANSRGHFAGTYVLLRTALGLVAYFIAMSLVLLGGYPEEVVRTTALAGVVLPLGAASHGLEVIFQLELRLGVVAVAKIVAQLGQLALTVLIALTSPTLLLFVVPAIAFDIIAGVWQLRRVRRLLRLRYRVDLKAWRVILVQAAPLAVAGAMTAVAQRLDVVLMSKLDTFEAVGVIAVADKFVNLVDFFPLALAPPLLTLLVRSWPDDVDRFYATLRQGMLLMALAAGTVLVSFLPVAGDVIALLYGEQYRDAEDVARLRVAAACLGFFPLVVFEALVAMGRNRTYVYLGLVNLVTVTVASLLLIPRLSALGAAAARVVTGVVLLLALFLLAKSRLHERLVHRWRTLGALACGSLGLAVGFAVVEHALPWPVASAGGAVVYLAALHVTKVPGRRGLRSLLQGD